jgi:nucleoside-diphosphate-sugar epimerase
MVVGNGLIAQSLSCYINCDDILIFASGVSNSLGENEDNFERERTLLLGYRGFAGRLVYFSTCSVFDSTLVNTPYVIHKINMEKLITENFESYSILRLPTLVGRNDNPHIFFNYFKKKLKKSEPVSIFINARRHLLAIDDMPSIVELLLKNNKIKNTINVAFNNKARVLDIVGLMKKVLNSDSEIIQEEKGADFDIDNFAFMQQISSDEKLYLSADYENIIKKYL